MGHLAGLRRHSADRAGNDVANRARHRRLTLDGRAQLESLVRTPFAENNGELSPDGRWLAYQSNDSGRDEVYVRPCPAVGSGRWQVSTNGGRIPAWSSSGRELFYMAREDMMAVPIHSTPTFNTGTPVKLFEAPPASAPPMRYYDVSHDGQRFLLIKNPPRSTESATNIVVVLNWIEELRAKMSGR